MNNTEQITKSGKVGTSVKSDGSKKGFQKTKLGIIPNEWSTPTISEVFKFLRTTSFSRSQMNYNEDEGVFCIHYGDIHATYQRPILDFNENANIPKINDDVKLPTSFDLLQDGDLIIADASEDYEGIGSAIELSNINNREVLSGLHTFAFRDYKSKTIQGFRAFLFRNPQVKKALKTIATGSKVYGVSKGNLEKFRVVLPTIAEQQKIAKILSTWDSAIATQEKLITAKEIFKKGLMQVLLTGTKRFDGFDDDWEESKLNEVCSINPKNDTLPEKFIYIDLESVENGQLHKENEIFQISAPSRAQRLLKYDDILYQTVRPYQKNNLHFKKKGDYVASTGYAQVRAKQSSKFLYQFLHDNGFVNQVLVRCTGTSYPSINTKDLAEIRIKIPTEEEQIKIASILSKADEEMELLKQELINLEYQKRGLMQQLLTGAVRVKTT